MPRRADVDWLSRRVHDGAAGSDRPGRADGPASFMFNEDVDWCRRMKLQDGPSPYVPAAGVVHQVGASRRRCQPRVIDARHLGMIHYYPQAPSDRTRSSAWSRTAGPDRAPAHDGRRTSCVSAEARHHVRARSLILALAFAGADARRNRRGDGAGAPLGALDRPGPAVASRTDPHLGGLAMVVSILGGAWAAGCSRDRPRVLDLVPLIGHHARRDPGGRARVADDLRGTVSMVKLLCQTPPRTSLPLRHRRAAAEQPARPRRSRPACSIFPLTRGVGADGDERHQPDRRDRRARGRGGADRLGDVVVGGTDAPDVYVLFLTAPLTGRRSASCATTSRPPGVFMGDTGSQFLGLVLARSSLLETARSPPP